MEKSGRKIQPSPNEADTRNNKLKERVAWSGQREVDEQSESRTEIWGTKECAFMTVSERE